MGNEIQAPAMAYRVVADTLGERYFLTQPPPTGAVLEIEGLDGIPTIWRMSAQQAVAITEPLRHNDLIRRVTPSRY